MTAPTRRVFAGILERQSQWQGLSRSAMSVAAIYSVMLLGAVFYSGGQPTPRPSAREQLVVTLLDLPKLSELRRVENMASTPRDDKGGHQAASFVRKTSQQEPVRSTSVPKSKSLADLRPDSSAPSTQPTFAAAQAEPQQAAPAADAVASVGRATGAPGVASETAGTGAGLGTGSRAGSQIGNATVLPFMDGMIRPVLISMVAPQYTREARDAGLAGVILTKCVITTEGRLERCRIIHA